MERLKKLLRQVSQNNTVPCFVLKCDVKRFFQSINHQVLFQIIQRKIQDKLALNLVKEIIESFNPGLPIGNLTSQLFANIYLNELDQFIKHKLKIPFYLRYTDDFIIISDSRHKLISELKKISEFILLNLKLELHPNKIFLKKYHQGIDFLGYIQFPNYRTIRTKTKRRIIKKIGLGISEQSLQSYLGVLSHADCHNFSENIKNISWLNKKSA